MKTILKSIAILALIGAWNVSCDAARKKLDDAVAKNKDKISKKMDEEYAKQKAKMK